MIPANNPYAAVTQAIAAAESLGFGAEIIDAEPLKAAIHSHPDAARRLEEHKWSGISARPDTQPLTDPDRNPLIQIEIARRGALQKQSAENNLALDQLLEALDALWLFLRSHPQHPIWTAGLVAYEREQFHAERAAPGAVAVGEKSPQFSDEGDDHTMCPDNAA